MKTSGVRVLQMTRRLSSMMVVAALIGAASSVVGLYLSFYLSVASGAAVVLVATLIFMLTFLFAPERGLISRARHAAH
jgi:ABC-type Mn2+/Zn2+ transport system permease subunit